MILIVYYIIINMYQRIYDFYYFFLNLNILLLFFIWAHWLRTPYYLTKNFTLYHVNNSHLQDIHVIYL